MTLLAALALLLILTGSTLAADPEPSPTQPPTLSTNAAEVVRLAQAGVDETVLLAFVESASQPFELSSDQVVYLKDLGIADPVVAAMLRQDKQLREKQETPASPPVLTNPPPAIAITNPPAPVYVTNAPTQVTYFYDSLSPYGTWVDLEGVGWCWQPSVVVVNNGWRPYWHGGNWIYSDYGWYWRSDYSWGWAPFHYGRWHAHPRFHWVWVPDTVWGPAWVTWRYSDNYCGWAPLPFGAQFVYGQGWYFNGVSVGLNFGFGVPFHHYHYVETRHLHQRHLHHHGIAVPRAREIHGSTTVNNNQLRGTDNRIVNPGIPPDRVSRITGRPVPQARIEVEQPAGDRVVRRPERVERVGETLVVRRPELRAPVQLQSAPLAAQKINERTPIVRPMPGQTSTRGLPVRPPSTTAQPATSPAVPPPSVGGQAVRPQPPPRTAPSDTRTVPSRPSRPATTPAQPPASPPAQPPSGSPPRPAAPPPAAVGVPATGVRPAPSRVVPPQPSAPILVPSVPPAPPAESPRGHQQNPAYTRPAVPPSQPAVPRMAPPAARPSSPPPRQPPPSR